MWYWASRQWGWPLVGLWTFWIPKHHRAIASGFPKSFRCLVQIVRKVWRMKYLGRSGSPLYSHWHSPQVSVSLLPSNWVYLSRSLPRLWCTLIFSFENCFAFGKRGDTMFQVSLQPLVGSHSVVCFSELVSLCPWESVTTSIILIIWNRKSRDHELNFKVETYFHAVRASCRAGM